ncbi:MAG TPA: MFS transporter [Steroidobacteraceae bacterium]|nr:MFS transporter [Steroidobacteraceae bacterium]
MSSAAESQAHATGAARFLVALVFLIFFVISFLTNIMGALIPDIIHGFKVTLAMAAVLPFSFFMAYGVASIPAGFLVERWGDKPLMLCSFLAAALGALCFGMRPIYPVAVMSLFVMGAGMAALQVAINPLLRVAGGEQHFAFNSAFAQLIFGSASFVSPIVYSQLVSHLGSGGTPHGAVLGFLASVTPPSLPWVSIYWVFAACAAAMMAFIAVLRLPAVVRSADESAGTLEMYASLLRRPVVWAYFGCIVAYVGSEQGTADWISQFLSRYHGFDPHTQGATAVSYFWGLLTVGCLAGMLLLKLFDSRKVLVGFSAGALAALTLALFGSAQVSLTAFPCIGLFASIMWPTLVSLALNSVPAHHGPLAGILCTGIMGGALLPLLIGQLGDLFGLRAGMLLLYMSFGCVMSAGCWAKPLVNNALLGDRTNDVQARVN